jgi:hypothetical protein
VLAAALAVTAGACSNGSPVLEDVREGHFFDKPVFQKPDWAKLGRNNTVELGPKGPVGPEDLVNAAGECGPEVLPAQPAAPVSAEGPATPAAPPPESPPPGKAQVGSIAGDLASSPMAQGPPPAIAAPKRVASAGSPDSLGGLQPAGMPGAPVLGGIALSMTECQVVRRAGQPNQVAIGGGEHGVRKVVVTYVSGPWPGVYTFEAGRLKVIDSIPAQPQPAKPAPKRSRASAHTAATDRGDVR